MIKRLSIALVALLLLTGASGYGLHVYYKDRIFNPSPDRPDASLVPFPVETVSIETPDGLALNAWWHAPLAGEETILYLHGNSTSIGKYTRGTAPLVEAGYGVLMLEYRGYGGNPGALSDDGFLIDAKAGLDWLEDRGIPSPSVHVYGYSLGTGTAVPLAADRAVASVVLAAPFASIAEMGYDQFPKWFVDAILTDRFDSIARIQDVEEPVLIIHGTEDATVPQHQSERLMAAGGDNITRLLFDGAGHGWDLFEPRGNAAILDFLRQHESTKMASEATTTP
ncbi:alpha/beta hydrolase [Iodidimonas muriae]|uniref:Alpha/beta hydrolase n=1 Tax=Iodidimonas muriae TaxID=261467 RepID=A0ABQ2LBW6_9PROT|nr:alpha/beta fold hydrolase [Iodidimonas muriae]GER06832.1 alpha/beta hydrolase [Kordiimonadales bacterium JCM 17843]GGO09834.1 alpha/beta hydrolase [Iodidimonas muriae]